MKAQLTPIAAAAALVVLQSTAWAQAAVEPVAPAPVSAVPPVPAAPNAPVAPVSAVGEEKVDRVEITGIRAAQQKSLQTKRDAESRVEVITAEDVGKMPDKNVADSLQRVPGVSTTSAGSSEGSFGENEHVQMRGLSSQMTLTTLNGHLVSTGDWYGPNIAAGGRSVTFTLLPSDLIGRVLVHKSSQADLIEGGAAGTVDIQTRHPLDFKNTFSGVATLEAAHSDAAKTTDPSVSALLNWKNADSTFGILGQVFSQSRHLQRAGSEGVWWDRTGVNYPDETMRDKAISLLSGAVLFEQERKREGGYLEFQFRPSDALEFNLSGFYSTMKAKNYNTNFMADLINPIYGQGWNGNQVLPTGTPVVRGDTVTSVFYGADAFDAVGGPAGAFSVVEDVAARPDAKTNSAFINLDAKWKLTDALTLTTKVGNTSGGGQTKDVGFEVLSAWNQGAGYTINNDGIFILNVPGGDKFVKSGAGIGGWGSYSETNDSETYGQVDAEWRLDSDMVPSVKFGLRAAAHRRELIRIGMTLDDAARNEDLITDDAVGNYASDWFGNLPTNPTPGFRPFKISNDFVADWVRQYATFVNHATQQEFDIRENTQAAYGMANLAFGDNISGNVGVRLVRTTEDIEAFLPGGAPNYEKSFNDVLPSLNLRAELAKNLIGRFALNRGMSRPDFGQLAGNDLRDLQHVGVGSNPYLEPIRSNNVDASVEWYFGPKSAVSAAVFHSQLDGVIAYGHQLLPYADQSNGGAIALYDVSSPVNTEGSITGFEFMFQHALGLGFGVDVNYTYSDGKQTKKLATGTCDGSEDEDCSLYGTSKDVYNIGGYFENDSVSLRVAYSHRSTYKLGNRGGRDYFQSGGGQLNLAASYNINDSAAVTFEAQNILDPLTTTYVGNSSQINGVYKAGRMYFAGVRLKF